MALFITIWLNRIRPLLLIVSITLANLVLAYYAPIGQESVAKSILFPLVSFMLPLNIFLWTLLPEKGVINRGYNFFVVSLITLQLLFVYWFMNEMPLQLIEEISRPIAPDMTYFHLPFISAFVFLVAGFSVSLKLQKQKQVKVFDHSVLFVLLLIGFGLNQYEHAGVFQLVSSFAMIIVMLALVFDSHHIAYTDDLTGLKSRRALNEYLMSLGNKYVIVMVDIDFFKQFNDSYGHDLGDVVLQMVASILNDVKKGGRAFRFGGEEFTLVFKYRELAQVKEELERLRVAVESEVIEVISADSAKTSKSKVASKLVNVTISLGAAEATKNNNHAPDILKLADQCLYKAKKAGRNKLVVEQAKSPNKNSKSKNKN